MRLCGVIESQFGISRNRDFLKGFTTQGVTKCLHVLEVAGKTLKVIMEDHQEHCEGSTTSSSTLHGMVQKNLKFYTLFLNNLRLRASAFEQRLQNEILLAFNLFAADDNATSKEILLETRQIVAEARKDNRDLTNLVSVLTLLLLPGMFIAGFFGMNFFTLDSSQTPPKFKYTPRFWIFFATTVPITALSLAGWFYYRAQRSKSLNPVISRVRSKQSSV